MAARRLRRCTWPGCRRVQQVNLWCWSHWTALGEALQLRFLHAPAGSVLQQVLADCHQHAVDTKRWRQANVAGTGLAPKE